MSDSKYENVRAEWRERVGLDSFTQFMQVYRLHLKPEDIRKKKASKMTFFSMLYGLCTSFY